MTMRHDDDYDAQEYADGIILLSRLSLTPSQATAFRPRTAHYAEVSMPIFTPSSRFSSRFEGVARLIART